MSDRPCLSVVIPTRNRRQVLSETLTAIDASASLPGPLQVIVAVDGSSDDTASWLESATYEGFELEAVVLPPGGPARARNRAIERASAPRVLLLGDDTRPGRDTMATHLGVAGKRDVAVQGRIDWDPAIPITDVMAFLAPEGPQFYFKGLDDLQPIPYTAVLGSNLSAPTEWFETEPFDERFTEACFEDTEMAWRWHKRGWTTVFSQSARCLHRHWYDRIEPFLDRQRRAGRWARMSVADHPGMLPRVILQPMAFSIVAALRLAARGRQQDRWDMRCRIAFARGFVGL
jgi:GT2 family glycosyltransferase